eukprot:1672703-Amphidinium_carterae.1
MIGGSLVIVGLAADTLPAAAKNTVGEFLEYITATPFPTYGPDGKALRPAPGAIREQLLQIVKYHLLCGLAVSPINNLGGRPTSVLLHNRFDVPH